MYKWIWNWYVWKVDIDIYECLKFFKKKHLPSFFCKTPFSYVFFIEFLDFSLIVKSRPWLCFSDLGKLNLLMGFDFKLKPFFATAPEGSKNDAHYKSGPNWLKIITSMPWSKSVKQAVDVMMLKVLFWHMFFLFNIFFVKLYNS
jgi:hypothetical protein